MTVIAERADFSFSHDRAIKPDGLRFAARFEGCGRGHEETYLGYVLKEGMYYFYEEDIAPSAGYFTWIVLTVPASAISNKDELRILCVILEKKRFPSRW